MGMAIGVGKVGQQSVQKDIQQGIPNQHSGDDHHRFIDDDASALVIIILMTTKSDREKHHRQKAKNPKNATNPIGDFIKVSNAKPIEQRL
jgi:hypothetical protein